MIVYLDIVFIENTLMNYIILLATGIVCKKNIKQIRIIIASILGSMYAIAYYITRFPIYISIISKIILSIVMIYISFKPLKIGSFFKYLVIFYLTSFAFGGCAFAILYYLDSKNVLLLNGNFIGIYPIKAAILGGILGFLLINMAFKIVKNKLNTQDMFCNIKIFNKGKQKIIKAIIDTGNFLQDPITNTPVIIIEKDSLKDMLPIEILNNTKEIINGTYKIKDRDYLSKLRILPFSSLGKNNGMLLGIRIDKTEVELNDEYVVRENIIIGIYDNKLSINNKYGCLVGLNYLET